MKRLVLLIIVAFSLNAADKPNVIIVITDDQGYGDLSCHGNPILKTPHLDQLHGESIRLTDYHVSPTCSPTRGALMSGRDTNRCGTWHTVTGRTQLFEDQKTLAEVFKKNGYATGMFGKWHLGDNFPFRPEDRGFDEVVRHGGGGVGQTPDYWGNSYFDDTYWHNSQPKPYKGYCTDVFFDEAKRFIRDSIRVKKPFFAYVSTNAPHSPYVAPEKYWKPYAHIATRDPRSRALAKFYGMIANIDENVGKLRAFLKQENVADNTIFIFTTDNGTTMPNSFNAGMSGTKGSNFDGGHRVPFFLYWKNGKLDGGRNVRQLSAHVDVMPTLVELCGLDPIDEGYKLDGKSLVPILKNTNATWPDRTIITDSQRREHPAKWNKAAVMTQKWRLLNRNKLFDIAKDPAQKNDVSDQFPEVVSKLQADYDAWWQGLAPAFKKRARTIVGNPAENPVALTIHDCYGHTPWTQSGIRRGPNEKPRNVAETYWELNVEATGTYQISVCRWPLEQGAACDASVPSGDPNPEGAGDGFQLGVGRALKLKTVSLAIGQHKQTVDYVPAAQGTTFQLKLDKGPVKLQAHFGLADGSRFSAYYVYVEKQ